MEKKLEKYTMLTRLAFMVTIIPLTGMVSAAFGGSDIYARMFAVLIVVWSIVIGLVETLRQETAYELKRKNEADANYRDFLSRKFRNN